MTRRDRILEYILVMLVTVLIWLYAEGAIVQEYPTDGTRSVTVKVQVENPDLVILEEPTTEVQLQFRGSAGEISKLEAKLSGGLTLRPEISEPGEQRPVLRDLVMESPELADLHVNLLNNHQPRALKFTVDRMVSRQVNLVFVPKVDLVPDTLKINPQQVQVRLPQILADRLGPNPSFEVEPVDDLLSLPQGVPLASRVARVQIPAELAATPYSSFISIKPSQVELAFTIDRKEVEAKLELVEVKHMLPDQAVGKYRVILSKDSKVLRNVTIIGPSALVEDAKQRKVRVDAFLALDIDRLGREAGKGEFSANVQFIKPQELKVNSDTTTVRYKVERIE